MCVCISVSVCACVQRKRWQQQPTPPVDLTHSCQKLGGCSKHPQLFSHVCLCMRMCMWESLHLPCPWRCRSVFTTVCLCEWIYSISTLLVFTKPSLCLLCWYMLVQSKLQVCLCMCEVWVMLQTSDKPNSLTEGQNWVFGSVGSMGMNLILPGAVK